MKVIADTREKNSLVAAELVSKKIEVDFQHLAVADYLIGEIAIERKTASDFISSIINKRLMRQLEEIKQYPKQLLIIEGLEEIDFSESKFHPNAIKGMILSILTDFSVPIILTKDYQETAEYMALIVKRLEKKPIEIGLRAKKRTYNLAEQQQIVLEGFPGIGPSLAKRILKKFKTIKKIVNATDKELGKIERLDKNKIKNMKKIINEKYN
ncbi:hypothetical protein HZA33_03120 [Candidatus Pacearchaeota archaeon]|nr:hypothetical protein [Candidatus Pacearchaeota archaeon]